MKKRSLGAAIALALSMSACGSPLRHIVVEAPQSAAAQTLAAGTTIQVESRINLSSRTMLSSKGPVQMLSSRSREGAFVVAQDIASTDGTVLLAKGTPVRATVTGQKHRRIGRNGWIQVQFISVTDKNSAVITLDDTPIQFEGKSRQPGMIAGTIFLGALFLLRTGGDVMLQAGSTLETTVIR